ncbi:response regulator [Leifsonia xyli]|uniref:response regulator n=1 Tax=Leifsonia xyli TaxID=1575 RepID=UPI003D668C26
MDTDRADRSLLVVDDDPLIRLTFEAALAGHGYRVTTAGDLQAAAEAASAGADPDAVLLDATVPGCSLSESLDLLRRRPDGTLRPILVMSGSLTRPAELAGTGIGYLTKPIPLTELLDAVTELLASVAGTAADGAEAGRR